MNKYLSLFKYEAKTIARDPINLYMCAYPLIILVLSCYVFPLIFDSMDPVQGTLLKVTMLLLIIIILAFGPFALAALATFLLLEHKDEHTLNSIAVTPIGTGGYLGFKMVYIYTMAVVGDILVLLGTMFIAGDKYSVMGVSFFGSIGWEHIVAFALVNGMFAPTLGLLQGAISKNKVEGFAVIKGTGILALVPALMVLETFQGKLQYVLGIFPNFWAVRAMLVKLMPVALDGNLSFPVYLLIGAAYNAALLVVAYRLFLKRAEY